MYLENSNTGQNAASNDLHYLTEQAQPWSEILKDILKQNDIPTFSRSVMGAGMVIRAGAALDRTEFYVPSSHFEKAKQIVEELFSNDGDNEK